MRNFKVPQWIPTALLVLLVPVIGYLTISNIEGTRQESEAGAQSDTEAHLIWFMQQQYGAAHKRRGFKWTISRRDGDNRLVCYCDKKGYGWWYQVQITPNGFASNQVADTSAASTVPQNSLPSIP